jgi:hypothetical protein
MTITNIDKLPPVAQLLARARALILDESHWTKGAFARPQYDSQFDVAPDSAVAVCWCAEGAILKFSDYPGEHLTEAQKLLDASADKHFGAPSAPWVNDNLGHEAVIQMFDFAIGAAVKEGV